MKWKHAVLYLFIGGLVPAVAAQKESNTELPSCALDCAAEGLGNIACSSSEAPCACPYLTGTDFKQCIKRSCAVRASIVAQNVTATQCDLPVRNESGLVGTSTTVLGSIALVAIALRMFGRPKFNYRRSEMMDDWIMVINAIFIAAFTAVGIEMGVYGYGRDIYTLSFESITRVTQLLYASEILYNIIVTLTRLSILSFYLRVFPRAVFPALRLAILLTMTLVLAAGIALTLPVVFQCRPISFVWDFWNSSSSSTSSSSSLADTPRAAAGACIDLPAYGWSNASISLALNLALLALPMPELLRLTALPARQRAGACLMFALGGFVVFVTVPRLRAMVHFRHTANPTWDLRLVSFWAVVEGDVGVICACLPRIGVLVSRVWDRFGRATGRGGHGNGDVEGEGGSAGGGGGGAAAAGGIWLPDIRTIEYGASAVLVDTPPDTPVIVLTGSKPGGGPSRKQRMVVSETTPSEAGSSRKASIEYDGIGNTPSA